MSAAITVIVPTRDRPEFLRQALESVQAQDFDNFECLVVDDGSRDFEATVRVVKVLRDVRFRVIQSRVAQTMGAESIKRFAKGLALNTGIEQATTGWLAFLDDDDVYAPYRLSRGIESLRQQRDARLTVGSNGEFGTDLPDWPRLPPLRVRAVRNPMAQMMPHVSTWTLCRSLAYDVGLFRPYGVMQDWEFYARLSSMTTIWRDHALTVAIRRHDTVRDNYGLHARIKMREDLLRAGVLKPNGASRAFQLYRLSQQKMQARDHAGAVTDALTSLLPFPYPRYIMQTLRAISAAF